MMPAFPPFFFGLVALPLLVPVFGRRLAAAGAPRGLLADTRRAWKVVLAVSAAALAAADPRDRRAAAAAVAGGDARPGPRPVRAGERVRADRDGRPGGAVVVRLAEPERDAARARATRSSASRGRARLHAAAPRGVELRVLLDPAARPARPGRAVARRRRSPTARARGRWVYRVAATVSPRGPRTFGNYFELSHRAVVRVRRLTAGVVRVRVRGHAEVRRGEAAVDVALRRRRAREPLPGDEARAPRARERAGRVEALGELVEVRRAAVADVPPRAGELGAVALGRTPSDCACASELRPHAGATTAPPTRSVAPNSAAARGSGSRRPRRPGRRAGRPRTRAAAASSAGRCRPTSARGRSGWRRTPSAASRTSAAGWRPFEASRNQNPLSACQRSESPANGKTASVSPRGTHAL